MPLSDPAVGPDSGDVAPHVQTLARTGYTAIGVVYMLVGGLAAAAALGTRGESKGTRGALATVVDAPFGRFALAVAAVGLVAYALWRFAQAALDPEDRGTGAKALARRAGLVVSGLVYTSLAVEAGRLALTGGGGSGGGAEDWTARLLALPFGRFAVGAVGVGVAGHGLYQIQKAFRKDPLDPLDVSHLSEAKRTWLRRTGEAGLAARGVVFALAGVFLVVAAWQDQSGEARGLGGVLRTLERQPAGPYLLAVVAVGLAAYGLFQFAHARYHTVEAE